MNMNTETKISIQAPICRLWQSK